MSSRARTFPRRTPAKYRYSQRRVISRRLNICAKEGRQFPIPDGVSYRTTTFPWWQCTRHDEEPYRYQVAQVPDNLFDLDTNATQSQQDLKPVVIPDTKSGDDGAEVDDDIPSSTDSHHTMIKKEVKTAKEMVQQQQSSNLI